MGRTVPTYRMHLEGILARWQDYRRALREEDRTLFDKVVNGARQHASAAGYTAHLDPVETALLGMMIEMQREIERLKASE
jgi:hypothetical protein